MRIIRTQEGLPEDALGQLAVYNGMDCLTLPEIIEGLHPELTPHKLATYRFELDLQSVLLEMEFNGCPVDMVERQRLTLIYRGEQTKFNNYIHQLCEAVGYYTYYKKLAAAQYSSYTGIPIELLPLTWEDWKDLPIQDRREWKLIDPNALALFHKRLKKTDEQFNANSPTQKLQLFYHFFGSPSNATALELYPDQPPPWLKTHGIGEYKAKKQSGKYGPSTDRDALEKMQKKALDADERHAVYWAQPFISCCLAIADCTKALGFLTCNLEDGYFRASFASSPETGRLSSSENCQGYGSNAQNQAPKLRSVLTCELGTKIGACDYEQIESRNVGAICYELFGATAYLNATACGDLHTLACSLVWPDLPWPADFNLDWFAKHGKFPAELIKAAKKIAGGEFYRGKSRRDVSKTLGHGSNYLGKPPHMAKQSHIPLDLVEHYQDVYFAAFPEIKMWHQWTIEQLMATQEITTTVFHRTRQFFGRPSDDSTVREAVAYNPQSMGADYTDQALLAMHKAVLAGELPIKIFLQKHDEIGFRFAESDEHIVIPAVCDIMQQEYTLVSPDGVERKWSIPVEALVGWNLGHKGRDGSNPDGLVVWTGKDERVRKENPFDVARIQL